MQPHVLAEIDMGSSDLDMFMSVIPLVKIDLWHLYQHSHYSTTSTHWEESIRSFVLNTDAHHRRDSHNKKIVSLVFLMSCTVISLPLLNAS